MCRKENLVSVIIPVYKVAWIIDKTIQSVLNQTYRDFEIVLVDDCLPDNSAEINDKIIEFIDKMDENLEK